jgi:hypothetical protein
MFKKLLFLLNAIDKLGFRLGYRYWRIFLQALKNPELVLVWASLVDKEANNCALRGETMEAEVFRNWAAELRKSYERYKEILNRSI